MKNLDQDTIVAPVTSLINQTIGKIRVSGDKAFNIINKIVNKELNTSKNTNLRFITYNDKILDKCIFIIFKKPHSFTGEDVIEIDCHGNKILVMEIINILIENGCRIADNGEFTKRAFYNNKIDLIQADAINNIINAKNKFSLLTNSQILNGDNSNRVNEIKDNIIDLISKIQTSIDYPDYDEIENADAISVINQIENISKTLDHIIIDNNDLLRLSNGIKLVLTGETNVGKSSILNSLARDEVAIVSNINGTTRDTIKIDIEYKGLSFEVWDTAGIRETNDEIEKIGIIKANDKISSADLVLHVFDNIEKLQTHTKGKNELLILNKIDLINKIPKDILDNKDVFLYSSFNDSHINLLIYLYKKFELTNIIEDKRVIYLSNYNELEKIKIMNNIFKNIVSELKNGQFLDIILSGIYECLEIINSILGINSEEEVINNIFKKYCLGK